ENFSVAARRLHLSQPAVSQHIQALERELGIALFHRQGRQVKLTEAGHVLMPLAYDLLAHSCRVEETMRSLGGELVGVLTIACSTTTGKYILPHLIARFRERHPAVRARVDVLSQRMALERLRDGHVDLAITSSRLPHKDLVYQDFFTDYVVLIVPADHPWAKLPSVRPTDLCSVPLIIREETSGTWQVVQEGLARHGVTLDRLNIVMELGNAEAIAMAVEEGIGVAFVSRLVAKRGMVLGRIREVPVEGLELHREIAMAYNAARPGTAVRQAFWQFVHEPDNAVLLQRAKG
ncbi:MAG: LysR family transcriptional regulator, partial [Caldilineales bacterium]|nr:LysR family transcriptional regulator [Caldilineales bacterium]